VGASFVARWSIFHVRQLKEAVLRAMQIRGFTFIEVLSPCPTGFGRANHLSRGLDMMKIFQERCQVENGAPQIGPLTVDVTDDTKPIVLGNFLDEEREPYSPRVVGPITKRGPAEWAAVRKTRYDADSHA
jgi:2-oxoglutarate ferredoxin oxidoreductase subunit beta